MGMRPILGSLIPYFDLSVDIAPGGVSFAAWAQWDLIPIWELLTGGYRALC